MNHISDAELALLAGGDWEPSEHLRACAECRARLEEFEAAREWLKEMAVAPSKVEVQALESAVLARLAPRRHFRWWITAAAAVAAVLLVFGGIEYFSPAPPQIPVPVIAMALLPKLEHGRIELKLPRTLHRPQPAHLEHRVEAMTVVSENNGSPVVRLKTSDPNVIVLWVLNTPPKEGNIHE